jgi:hypothetical protein
MPRNTIRIKPSVTPGVTPELIQFGGQLPQGLDEETVIATNEKIRAEQNRAEIVTETSRNLLKLSSFGLPPILFPVDIIIDELKVSFVYHGLFWQRSVRSFLIKDISDVILDTNFLFGVLKLVVGEFKEKEVYEKATDDSEAKESWGPIMVKYLNVDEAAKARRMIQGLIILTKMKEDTSKLSAIEVAARAEELGRAV